MLSREPAFDLRTAQSDTEWRGRLVALKTRDEVRAAFETGSAPPAGLRARS